MALIFNSITQFEIQPERTKRRVKRDDLDTLTEVWVGPSDQEDIFVPAIGSVHPSYNLMTVTDSSIRRIPANVSEVTITYQGKLDNSGSGSYTSSPTINHYWSEGEVSYQAQSGVSIPVPGGGWLTQPGVSSYSRRYTGRCVQMAYITNRRPTSNPTNLGLANDFLGFTNIWDTFAGFSFGGSPSAGLPIQQMTCTDVKVDDLATGWYRVTETYQSRMFPGAARVAPQTGSISVQTGGKGAEANNAQWTAAYAAADQAWQQQLANAGLPSQALPSSSDPVSQDTAQATGYDPSWSNVDGGYWAASNAVTSSASDTNTTDVAAGSQALTY